MDDRGPLGPVELYFWRREYQVRGAARIHSKFWIKNASVYGVDPDQKVLDFINS